ncbi:MAG: hypothetical protein ACYTG6_06190 [Planctomycetota bacterium]
MRPSSRVLTGLFLALLVLAWGPCPCVVMKMFQSHDAGADGASTAPSCCCKRDRSEAPVDEDHDDDCPCCKVLACGIQATAGQKAPVLDAPVAAFALEAATALPGRLGDHASSRPLIQPTHGPPGELRKGTVLLI